MGIKLVRESSETPNIQNKDDAKMIRYAYGGYDGVVKGYGQELMYTFENSVFKIGSGRIVVQGWEVDIDESGWSLDLSGITGLRFYVVYIEVNLVTQKAEIKSTWSASTYPSVLPGDDLTTYPNGISRMLLYSFKLINGSFTLTETGFPKINYLKDWVAAILRTFEEYEDSIITTFRSGEMPSKYAEYAYGGDVSKGTIEERLTKLGFKKGQVTTSTDVNLTQNEIIKIGTVVYGNYVMGRITGTSVFHVGDLLFTVPEGYRPYTNISLYGLGTANSSTGSIYGSVGILLSLNTEGEVVLSQIFGSTSSSTYTLSSLNLNFGYLTVNPSVYE